MAAAMATGHTTHLVIMRRRRPRFITHRVTTRRVITGRATTTVIDLRSHPQSVPKGTSERFFVAVGLGTNVPRSPWSFV